MTTLQTAYKAAISAAEQAGVDIASIIEKKSMTLFSRTRLINEKISAVKAAKASEVVKAPIAPLNNRIASTPEGRLLFLSEYKNKLMKGI